MRFKSQFSRIVFGSRGARALPLLVALTCSGAVERDWLPKRDGVAHKFQVVEHLGYTLGYCECWEEAGWVVEVLSTNSFGSIDRVDDFRADPAVLTGSATLADYKGSGYDRGHLAPAADFSADDEAMSESFYLSNMTPQNAGLNRGAWAKLESWVRDRVTGDKALVVVTGPIVTNATTTIGESEVVVPNGYYKVLYDQTDPKMIAFTYANAKGQNADPAQHVTTVDEVEALTGLDFFPTITNAALEATSDYTAWTNTVSTSGFMVILTCL